LGTIAIVLSGTTIRRAARELLVAAEFSLGPIRTGTIAIARRPGAIGPIATRTVAVLAKTFATRCVGSLLAAAFARGIWLPVAELSIGRTPGRTRIVAIPRAALAIPIPPRRTVVAVETGTIAARLERALLTTATIFTRLERTPLTIVATGRTAGIGPITTRARSIAKVPPRRAVVAVALAGIRLSIAGIRLLAERLCAVGLPGIGTPLAVAFTLSGESALGELLLRPPRRPGAALAAARPVPPAAGIVVFVGIAGHEWSLGYG
jgi:hypothetical protein